ncbi:MAG: hypothetical protein WC752_00035 [Patescibacteria group bacterium]|jgi:hypothetical protein
MKKYLYIPTLIIIALLTAGCGQDKSGIANVSYDMLDNNSFTLESVADKTSDPIIAVLDEQSLLDTMYTKMRKNNGVNLAFEGEKELVIMAMRGKKGSCDSANLEIKKIRQSDKKLIVEILTDSGQTSDGKDCAVIMNPYQIVKIAKENIEFEKKLQIELVDFTSQKVLATTELNTLPGFLK